jgi:carbon storage regulator
MLVLSRRASQSIVIGTDIRITIVKVERNQVRIGIEAPPAVRILRDELVEKPAEGPDDDSLPNSSRHLLAV